MANIETPSAKILVIDDEPGMQEGCRRALTSLGHVVETAPDLTTGRRLIYSQRYDLCLLDVLLPDGNGLDFLGVIRKRDPTTICIIITGYGTMQMAVEAVRQGAYNFLAKPFTTDELYVAVKQGLEQRRLKAIEIQATELARAKAELEKLDQVKSQLMLHMAHELRAPLAAVQSYLNLILAGYVAESELRPTLARTKQLLQEMLDLIADLLELARLKQAADRIPAVASSQNMADALLEVTDLFRAQAESKNQSLEVNVLDRPIIVANRDHLKQIWSNLISNAIKYTPEGGRILVQLQADSVRLEGVVEDSGIGIDAEDLPNLFHEFFRTDAAKATGQIGTGLGLSIVKQIIESYGGQIEVTSAPGKGSRFVFSLPLQLSTGALEGDEAQDETSQAPLEDGTGTPASDLSRRLGSPVTHTRAVMLSDEANTTRGTT